MTSDLTASYCTFLMRNPTTGLPHACGRQVTDRHREDDVCAHHKTWLERIDARAIELRDELVEGGRV